MIVTSYMWQLVFTEHTIILAIDKWCSCMVGKYYVNLAVAMLPTVWLCIHYA